MTNKKKSTTSPSTLRSDIDAELSSAAVSIFGDLFARMEKMIADIGNLSVSSLEARLSSLEEQLRQPATPSYPASGSEGVGGPPHQVGPFRPYGAPPLCLVANDATRKACDDLTYNRLLHDVTLMRSNFLQHKKSFHAVVERMTESPNAVLTTRESLPKDISFINNVCDSLQISKPVSVWRHPCAPNSKARCRPLKVKFHSPEDRNTFIASFNKSAPVSNFPGRRPTVRRDMTPHELSLLYHLRKQVYTMNNQCVARRYFVKDLEICERPQHLIDLDPLFRPNRPINRIGRCLIITLLMYNFLLFLPLSLSELPRQLSISL